MSSIATPEFGPNDWYGGGRQTGGDHPDNVNLGLTIDLPAKGGGRNLLVVPIPAAEAMSFSRR